MGTMFNPVARAMFGQGGNGSPLGNLSGIMQLAQMIAPLFGGGSNTQMPYMDYPAISPMGGLGVIGNPQTMMQNAQNPSLIDAILKLVNNTSEKPSYAEKSGLWNEDMGDLDPRTRMEAKGAMQLRKGMEGIGNDPRNYDEYGNEIANLPWDIRYRLNRGWALTTNDWNRILMGRYGLPK